MIWSIIPEEIIFGNLNQDEVKSGRRTRDYLGKRVQTIPYREGEDRIIALISSNPQDFLDLRFSPGTIIKN